jgi:DNA polymerase
MGKKTEKMREIKDEVVNFKISPLYKFRVENKNYPVIGEGSHNAKIMFVGEAPGKNEAATGKPFCGRAGKILDDLLDYIKVDRTNVYVTNILKDRPPDNRDPLPEEVALYAPFLDRQIEIIKPQVIATLGRFSMKYIMDKFLLEEAGSSISSNHGRIFEAEASYGKIKIIPLFHPAVATYSPTKIEDLKKDFKILKQFI